MDQQENKSINEVEQITKEPVVQNSKAVKDPKKIAAGKKLAAYNKKPKENKKKISSSTVDEPIYEAESKFDISLTTIVAILGLGLTAVDLHFRYKNNGNGVKDFKMVVKNNNGPIDLEKKDGNVAVKTVSFSQGME